MSDTPATTPTPEGQPMTAERIAYLGSVSMTREEGYELLAEVERARAEAVQLREEIRALTVMCVQTEQVNAGLEKRLAEIGETTVEWAIRTDSTDHAPDSPHLGSEQKVILNYPMDEQHARKHSKPWGWQAIHRVVGKWHDAEQEADHG